MHRGHGRRIVCDGTPSETLTMSDPVFLQAFATVRKSCSDGAWNTLTPRQITEAIYQEIRRIDAGAAKPGPAPAPGSPPDDRSK
jgi:hypothetical protein